jgi:hypothetical protein
MSGKVEIIERLLNHPKIKIHLKDKVSLDSASLTLPFLLSLFSSLVIQHCI